MADPTPIDALDTGPTVVGGPTFPNGMAVPSGWLVPPPVDPTGVAAAFDALHPDDRELAKLADHTGVAKAFDALHPDDQAAAAAVSAPPDWVRKAIEMPSGTMAGLDTLQPGIGIPSIALDQAQPVTLGPPRPTLADLTGRTSPDFEGLTVGNQEVGDNGLSVPLPADSGAAGQTSFLGAPVGAVTALGEPGATPSSLEGKSPLSGYTAAQLTAMATSDDPKEQARFVALKTLDESWRADKQAADLAQAQKDRRWQVEQDLKNQQYASDQAQAKLKQRDDALTALQNQKIDPRRYWSSLSAGGKFANLLGAIAGGIAAGQVPGGNGQNLFLNDLNKQIEQDIDAQKANLENSRDVESSKRGILAQSLALTGNMQQATAVAHQAMYAEALNQLTTAQQQYDPAGRRAMAIASNMAQLKANMIAQAQATTQRDFDDSIKATTAGTTVLKVKADIAHQKAQEGLDQQRVGIEGYRASLEKRAQDLDNENKALDRDAKLQEASLKQKDANDTKIAEQTIGVLEPSADGKVSWGKLKLANGDPWVVSKEEAPKIAKQVAATSRVNALVNDVLRKTEGFSGASDTVKGKRWQEVTAAMHDLDLEAHAAKGIESFRPGTIDVIQGLYADMKPTSWVHDGSPALRSLKENLTADLNADLHHRGWDNPNDLSFADTSRPTVPQETLDQQKLKEAGGEQDQDVSIGDRAALASKYIPGAGGIDGSELLDPGTKDAIVAGATGRPSEHTKEIISGWATDLGGKDVTKRDAAAKLLYHLMITATSPGVRELAKKTITDSGETIVGDDKGVGHIVKLPGDDIEGARDQVSHQVAPDTNESRPDAPKPKPKEKK